MPTQAKVTSADALETFRASLVVFLSKAQSSLDQVSDEIRRTRAWLQHEQRLYWEGEIRRRTRSLQQAQQELLSAKLIKLLDNLSTQQAAVRKARHALEEAEEKLRNVKRWMRDFDSTMDPLAKSLDSLREYLAQDIPKGIASLSQTQRILTSYSETSPPGLTASIPTNPDAPDDEHA